MSDFYTKKQRKYWCDKCRIFIEYTKMVIDQHNKSKNHLRMINSDTNYQQMKNKIIRHNTDNYGVENELTIRQKQNYLKNKTSRDVQAYSSGYGIDNSVNTNYNSNNVKISSSFSNSIIEEVKRKQLKNLIKEKFNVNVNIKNKKEKVWAVYYDPNTKLPYYYNFITQTSQWDKPDDFDGAFECNKEDNFCNETKKEVEIGKWELVANSESFFEKNKVKDSKLPGVISYDEYIKQTEENYLPLKFKDSNEEDDKLELDEKERLVSSFSDNKNIRGYKSTIDKFIYSNCEREDTLNNSDSFNIKSEDIIELNNKLKKNDYDMKFINQTYGNTNINNFTSSFKENTVIDNSNKDDLSTKEKITFSFNTSKKNIKKISKLFDHDSSE